MTHSFPNLAILWVIICSMISISPITVANDIPRIKPTNIFFSLRNGPGLRKCSRLRNCGSCLRCRLHQTRMSPFRILAFRCRQLRRLRSCTTPLLPSWSPTPPLTLLAVCRFHFEMHLNYDVIRMTSLMSHGTCNVSGRVAFRKTFAALIVIEANYLEWLRHNNMTHQFIIMINLGGNAFNLFIKCTQSIRHSRRKKRSTKLMSES